MWLVVDVVSTETVAIFDMWLVFDDVMCVVIGSWSEADRGGGYYNILHLPKPLHKNVKEMKQIG